MTEHARTCDRPMPVVRPFVIAGRSYVLTTSPRCGAQQLDRVPDTDNRVGDSSGTP